MYINGQVIFIILFANTGIAFSSCFLLIVAYWGAEIGTYLLLYELSLICNVLLYLYIERYVHEQYVYYCQVGFGVSYSLVQNSENIFELVYWKCSIVQQLHSATFFAYLEFRSMYVQCTYFIFEDYAQVL